MTIDNLTRDEITFDIERIRSVLDFGIFTSENSKHPLCPSALTELLIRLRDLLAKSENFAERVSFQDDVTIKGKVNDITSLVTFVRDALCHVDSGKHDHDEIQARISFNVIFGKGRLARLGSVSIESQYDDDVAFFFGPQRLYLRRHIIRAFDDARNNLLAVL
jgi:hypothetical protein